MGLAAGLDKEANTIDALGLLGFGHLEVGTLTPKPQDGNESPRLFRLPTHKALINRMGFNNPGIDQGLANARSATSFFDILGINIGKNKRHLTKTPTTTTPSLLKRPTPGPTTSRPTFPRPIPRVFVTFNRVKQRPAFSKL